MSVIMFWFFAILAIACALMVVFLKRLVNSAFALAGCLVGVAGLYWTLGADFIGTAQILIYVGGVTVLLLFAVMLTPKESTRVPIFNFLPAGVVVACVGGLLYTAFKGVRAALEARGVELTEPQPTADQIGRIFLEREGYIVAFELASVMLLIVVVAAVYIARRKREV
jgi:NADH:ubiquinone oxidoreductase subunit 6 (subunit J)